MLSTTLIEKVLALCDTTIYSMEEIYIPRNCEYIYRFSIEKFAYYLLSPEFIEKYWQKISMPHRYRVAEMFGEAIYEYQLGNESPLVELLTKI